MFLALLRGINVGGHNVISKDELRKVFEDLGFTNVRTYIQSGNIIFESKNRSIRKMTGAIEDALSKRLKSNVFAVVMSKNQYEKALRAAPTAWGTNADDKHNAMFTCAGTEPKSVLKQLPPIKEGIEQVTLGPGVLFWSASKKKISSTTMIKVLGLPIFKQLTVRNHNTTFKLLEMMKES